MVYFSPWLKDKKEGHPEFYQRLKDLLNGMGIESKELKSTNDYWARDYMPIQLGENEFLKYRYYPDSRNAELIPAYLFEKGKDEGASEGAAVTRGKAGSPCGKVRR